MLRGIFDQSAIPADKTLTPEQIADRIVAVVTSREAFPSGDTLFMPSPG